ncbi:MAG: hypothetical protein AAGA23_04485 [Pseudomonadota bacterium]
MQHWLGLLLLAIATASPGQVTDPFEPDDLQPLIGAIINGAQPDFVFPPNLPEPVLPDIERWLIEGRDLNTLTDIDWFVFFSDQYRFTPVAGQLRVLAADAVSQASLRVEVAAFVRESLVDLTVQPKILQSCLEAPVGDTVIDLEREDFLALYRLRACTGTRKLPYTFEFEITDREEKALLARLSGTVRDIRNNQPVTGAAVFTQTNEVAFSDLENGLWEFAMVESSDVLLDFLAVGLESEGPVSIGPVSETNVVDDVRLEAAPIGLIFFSSFEAPFK